MATAIAGSCSPPCPLGISMATGGTEGLRELGCRACVECGRGWAGEGRAPRCAQPQSTAALPASPSAAHLPASPPVRSPARWGSMAGAPLLRGPRAGGVGLLVLLLLGLLRPPPALCARPVKVRPRSGTGWGSGGGCYGRGSVLGCWPLILAGPSSRDMQRDRSARVAWGPASSPRPGHAGLGLWVYGLQCPELGQQPRPAHPSALGSGLGLASPPPVALSMGLACFKEGSVCIGMCAHDVMTGA